jgi:hypothetical protein
MAFVFRVEGTFQKRLYVCVGTLQRSFVKLCHNGEFDLRVVYTPINQELYNLFDNINYLILIICTK